MALDTRDRRASAIGVKLLGIRVFPNPDGSLASANDRRQIAAEYRLDADGGALWKPTWAHRRR